MGGPALHCERKGRRLHRPSLHLTMGAALLTFRPSLHLTMGATLLTLSMEEWTMGAPLLSLSSLNEGVDDGGPALQGTVSYFFTFSMEEWTMGAPLFKGLFPISSHSQ